MRNWRKLYIEGFVVNIRHQDYSGGKITNDRGILRVCERGAYRILMCNQKDNRWKTQA
jgi:hypothetical protein